MSSENAELEAPKIQKSSCTPWWYCIRRFRVLRRIHWTRIFSISNDSRQDHGYHLQIAGLRRTSSRRSIRLHPSKHGRSSQIIENSPKKECPDISIRLPRHKWPKSKTQLFLLSEICMVILWQDCCGKGNLRKSYWNMAGRKFPIENACSYTVKKGYSYLCMWMT